MFIVSVILIIKNVGILVYFPFLRCLMILGEFMLNNILIGLVNVLGLLGVKNRVILVSLIKYFNVLGSTLGSILGVYYIKKNKVLYCVNSFCVKLLIII